MRNIFRKVGLFTVFTGLLFSAGCIDLEPQPDPTRFYVLTSSAPAVGDETGDGLSIGIRRVGMPDYLSDSRMVTRRGDHEIVYADFHRWGENLDQAIVRVLAGDIADKNYVSHVSVFPWRDAVEHDYVITVDIYRFEGTAFEAVMEASWEIRGADGDKILKTGKTSLSRDWDGSNYAALAGSLSDMLDQLSVELSKALLEVSGS